VDILVIGDQPTAPLARHVATTGDHVAEREPEPGTIVK
jgi:hypothetical protein